MKKYYYFIFALFLAYGFGVVSQKYNWFPLKQIKSLTYEKKVIAPDYDTLSLSDFNNEDFIVIFTFGQSNAANYGQTLYKCKNEVYNWHNDTIYRAKDPLKGASGGGGSVWTQLGDLLIEKNQTEKVLLIAIGMEDSSVKDWGTNGKYYARLMHNLNRLQNQEIEIDYILWHQGETDNANNTSFSNYIETFSEIRNSIRDINIKAPIYVAQTSYLPYENILLDKQKGKDTIILNAQKELSLQYDDILLGPNTDILDKSYHRHDGLHFSVLGMRAHAQLWLNTLTKQNL